MSSERIFITSAIPYVNGNPHCGNLIGSTLSADVYARFCRKKVGSSNVLFVCGTDEFGSTTEQCAIQENLTCEQLCDKYRPQHERVYNFFNLSFDVFGRTPTETHRRLSQQIFTSLYENGFLIEKITEQYFCENCDRFVCDRFIHGVCHYENCRGTVKGDECENCAKRVDLDLVQKKWCSVCKSTPVKKSTKHLYLKLDCFKEQITNYFLNENSTDKTGVKYMSGASTRITKEWLNKDLDERCCTRDLKFGVPVPILEGIDGYENKIIWPWWDALQSYISMVQHDHPDSWQLWINDHTDWVAFMAKDNVFFHTVILPATLLGSGFQNLKCGITHLSATEYLLFNKQKFSKSDGIGIFGDQCIAISEKFGIDEDYWRYYLLKIRPETSDSTFDFESFCEVIKGELAQKIGNLMNRILAMSKKYYSKTVLRYDFTNFTDCHNSLKTIFENYIVAFDKFSYHEAIVLLNRVAEIGNEYINKNVVYNVCKEKPVENEHVMGNLMFIAWLFSELAEPIMPKKSQRIKTNFCVSGAQVDVMTTFDTMREILENPIGTVTVNHDDMQLLFKQIDPKDLLV